MTIQGNPMKIIYAVLALGAIMLFATVMATLSAPAVCAEVVASVQRVEETRIRCRPDYIGGLQCEQY